MTGHTATTPEQLLAAQRARFDASVARDIEALELLLADDLTYVHVGSRIDTKESFIASAREGRSSFTGFAVEAPVARVHGDMGVITATVHMTLRGPQDTEERILNVICTDVWTHSDAGWREVAWQATRIPD